MFRLAGNVLVIKEEKLRYRKDWVKRNNHGDNEEVSTMKEKQKWMHCSQNKWCHGGGGELWIKGHEENAGFREDKLVMWSNEKSWNDTSMGGREKKRQKKVSEWIGWLKETQGEIKFYTKCVFSEIAAEGRQFWWPVSNFFSK